MVHIFHTDGASSVGSDEGGVCRVSGSLAGPVVRQQAAVHHQVSGLADGHSGGWSEPGDREPRVEPLPAGLLPQGPGVPHHQPARQGTHLVSHEVKNNSDR